MTVLTKLARYNKFIVALLGLVSVGLTTWANGAHWADTIISGISAILVYLIPNAQKPAPIAQTMTAPGTYGGSTVVTPPVITQTPPTTPAV